MSPDDVITGISLLISVVALLCALRRKQVTHVNVHIPARDDVKGLKITTTNKETA